MSYVLPQVKVSQSFDEVAMNTVGNQNVFVFGPNYKLYRFNEEDERQSCFAGEFTGETLTVTFGENLELPYGSKLIKNGVKVFAVDALFNESEDDIGVTANSSDPTEYTVTSTSDVDKIKAGDSVQLVRTEEEESETLVTYIVSYNKTTKKLRVADSTLEYSADATYTLTPLVKKDVVDITEDCGLFVSDDKTITVTATESFPLCYGKIFVEYKVLLTDAADSIHFIETSSEIPAFLGKIDPENTLAYGVYMAAINAGGRGIYYMATTDDTLEAYEHVLGKAELTTEVYSLVPLTQNREILDAVEGHIDEMSTETGKRWRIGFFCAEIPELDPVYTEESSLDGEGYKCKVTSISGSEGAYSAEFVSGPASAPDTSVHCLKDLVVGDIVKIENSNIEYSFEITEITSNTILKIKAIDANPGSLSSAVCPAKAYHVMTYNEQIEYAANQSSGFDNRRIFNVFPTTLGSAGRTVNGIFAAAAVAGLTSSVLPQQPITNVSINGFDDVPVTYQQLTLAQLNNLAAKGTFIVMQDLPGTPVYVRHQLSTAASRGNLMTAELSITKNLDSISYYFANLFAPYIGKYNITPELIDKLESVLLTGLTYLETTTSVGLYGPQILAEHTKLVNIYQDESAKDHVICNLQIELPKPFNVFHLKLFAV